MPEPGLTRLREELSEAVRQPDFGTVRRRAGGLRRRRAVTAAAGLLATVLTAVGFVASGHDFADGRDLSGTAPAVTEVPESGWPRMTSVVHTGTDVYAVDSRCRNCDAQLYVSSDEGDSWQRRTVPPAPENAQRPREASLTVLATGVVAWQERTFVPLSDLATPATEGPQVVTARAAVPWITRDGGRSWQHAEISTQPVTAVPDGASPVDCGTWDIANCAVGVVDPATGRFAALATQPTGITVEQRWDWQVNVPLGGHLWIPGLDPVTKKPAVAASADGGRTWRTHVFTDGVPAKFHQAGGVVTMYLPTIAAGPGATAYVLTYRSDEVADVRYTTDGGSTWRTGDTVRYGEDPGYVTADGDHVLTTMAGGGGSTTTIAGRGTGKYAPVTLPGYPGHPSAAQIAGQYLVTTEDGIHLSADGRTWRRISPP